MKICDRCGKNYANHILFGDSKIYLCCRCYVLDGNPPADWHNECMETYNKLISKEVGYES